MLKTMAKILLIEDDVPFCKLLEKFLVKNSYEVTISFSASEAKTKIKEESYDLILTDLRLPDYDGIELMSEIKAEYPDTPVLLMTGYSDVNTAVKAIKNGAADYISKPFNPEEVLIVISNSLADKGNEKSEKVEKISKNKKEILKAKSNSFVQGISSASKKLAEYIQLVSPTNMSVLIIGESGTVKGSFTGAIQDKIGFFEAANGGTIFLDEIGNLSYENQIQLLRALQERKIKPVGSNKEVDVDIRIITATNEDLREAVKKGDFREDLYHRINEFSIHSPSLVEREEDLMLFSDFFLEKSNQELNKDVIGFSAEVMKIFQNYRWPGNLRELQNCIKRATLLTQGDFVEKSALPAEFFQSEQSLSEEFSLSENEKETILEALNRTNNNKTEAAKLLKINRKTLYNKLKSYGIN